jgi:hypothetical protein
MNEPNATVVPVKQVSQTLALVTLAVCLLSGVLGVILFDGHSWGLNLTLFGIFLVVSTLILKWVAQQPLSKVGYMLIASALFFLGTLVWRDSLVLKSLSFLGIGVTLLLAFTNSTRSQVQQLQVSEAIQDVLLSSHYTFTSYYQLVTEDIQWQEVQIRWGRAINALLRGLVMTIPIIILFGWLLTAADERFEAAVHHWLDWGWNWDTIMPRLRQYGITFLLSSWIAAALLRGSVLTPRLSSPPALSLPSGNLGNIEMVMMLSTLNLLFLSFIAVQFTYFFGGDVLVQSHTGPTYANYARRGFFQLVMVALLVMSLLFVTHWLHKPANQLQTRLYQGLAGVMVIMTMIIEASAAHRMYLYTRVYGLTELRFYTSVFMAWLVVLFVWFSLTVLRGQRSRFTFGALLLGLGVIGLLHLVNPNARIAEVNLARWRAGQLFDAKYVTSLSADAIPSIVAMLPTLPEELRCRLWLLLQSSTTLPAESAEENWRNWHWARRQAQGSMLLPLDCRKYQK